jgi:ketosteroid isomerase-like protein
MQRSQAELNVAFARRGYESFNEGGVEAILAFLEPEIEWISLAPAPLGGSYQGHDGVRAFFEQLFSLFEGVRIDPDEFIPIGEGYVLVFLRIWGRGTGTGVEGEVPVAMLWKVGKTGAAQVRLFYDRGEALEAARLEGYRS